MSEKIHILFLIDKLSHGGAERHLQRLVTSLDRSRFRPVVACLMEKDGVGQEIEAAGIPVFELGLERLYSPRAFRAARTLRRIARSYRIKIFHALLNSAAAFGPLVLADFKRNGLPVVLSQRDDGFGLSPFLEKVLRLNSIFLADRIVAVSEGIRRQIIGQWGVAGRRVMTIRNGVELPDYRSGYREVLRRRVRKALSLDEDAFLIGMVGMIKKLKGQEILIRALPQILKEFPAVHAVFFGDGEERPGLETLARSLGVGDRCHFLGTISGVAEWLPGLDLFVNLSETEGISNAILEAMAAEVPVVATAVGGTPEVIETGVHGVLLPSRDETAFAETVCRLLGDASLREKLGRNAARRARREFSLEGMVREFEKVYEQLLTGSGVS